MKNKAMPKDTSCRIAHGGCGRNVVIVREKFERKAFGGVLHSNQNTRLNAIHEDELDDQPELERQIVRATADQFMRFRLQLELRCVAQQERLKDGVNAETERRSERERSPSSNHGRRDDARAF
jgi:hypothetical protein